jgi:hypothetical protein
MAESPPEHEALGLFPLSGGKKKVLGPQRAEDRNSDGGATRMEGAGSLNDVHALDPAGPGAGWEDLTAAASGPPPSPRYSCGFAADDGGRLYVFGGFGDSGDGRLGTGGGAQLGRCAQSPPLV